MFPRVSWGLENRERSKRIPSRTPVGSSWTQQPPLHVTVDEHAATGTFHGFAGACLFELSLTPAMRKMLLYENRQPKTRRVRCGACGNRTPDAPHTEGPSFPDLVVCNKCSAPISGFGRWTREPTGSIAVLGALTTSGRLTCRPVTLNDPLLQLKLQRRAQVYASLARRQRLAQRQEPQGAAAAGAAVRGPHGGGQAQRKPPATAQAAFLSFHPSRHRYRRGTAPVTCQDEGLSARASDGHGAVDRLLEHLQGTPNESRVLPQRIPALLLQAQLHQRLQQDLLLLAALKWTRGRQLHGVRNAQLEGPSGLCKGKEMLRILTHGLAAMDLSIQWPRKLASFDYCDSGALGVHKPAFLTEAYDPEPLLQMLLTDPSLDAYLNRPLLSPVEETPAIGPRTNDRLESPSAGEATGCPAPADSLTNADGPQATSAHAETERSVSACAGTRPTRTNCLAHREEEQTASSCAAAAKALLEAEPRGPPGFTAAAEVSALPFPTARSRAVFRYAVETVETLSHATPEKSLLLLRDESSVLLHDVLVAVQLWRDRILTDGQTLDLLRPFSFSRPCTAGLLDMRRTTLPLGVSLPHSPQEALEAVMGAAGPPIPPDLSGVRDTTRDTASAPSGAASQSKASQGSSGDVSPGAVPAAGRDSMHGSFRKVANPALAPTLPCCCRVLLQHHCDVHSSVQGPGGGDALKAAEAECQGTHYPQTDGLQALLEVLKREHKRWLAEARCVKALRSICFLPQAIVDELAEALFLTHEVLLLPLNDDANSHAATSDPDAAIRYAAVETDGGGEKSAASADRTDLGNSQRPILLGAMDGSASSRHKTLGDRPAGRSAEGVVSATKCPLASPWLPACCLSRHLHAFLRSDRLLADDEQLQEELQRQAWPDLLLRQQKEQTMQAPQDARMQQFSQHPGGPSLELPQSMQSRLPEHILDGLAHSKWGRLLWGIAVTDAVIANLLRHWDVSAMQRMREASDEQRDRRAETGGEGQTAALRSDAPPVIGGLPGDSPGPVANELNRLLLLLPQTPLSISMFASVQARRQEQRRVQAERQQLLDTIARAMRQDA